jgi:hypothetical protein
MGRDPDDYCVLRIRGERIVFRELEALRVEWRVPQSVGQLRFDGDAGRNCGWLLYPKSSS